MLALPLSLVWACGSSSGEVGDTTHGGDAVGGSLAVGGDTVAVGGDGADVALGGADADGRGGSSALGGYSSSGASSSGGSVSAGNSACSNGLDDDGDGLIDGFDPECTGAADDDEGTFATGIPGDNRDPKWQDCFFDGNSGAGDDGCRYATGCLTGDLDRDDKACALTDACIEFCAPLVPNGCDCFGCCTVQAPGGDTVDVETSASCSVDRLGDTDA
ncbi:MAG TPA: hypothetical protein VEQ59_09095, partial [Polyangiaceae bacterium]|nr:hypothetical protein [Polyangiaceae bacterium]